MSCLCTYLPLAPRLTSLMVQLPFQHGSQDTPSFALQGVAVVVVVQEAPVLEGAAPVLEGAVLKREDVNSQTKVL